MFSDPIFYKQAPRLISQYLTTIDMARQVDDR